MLRKQDFFQEVRPFDSTDSQIYWGLFILALFSAPFKNSGCITEKMPP